VAWPSAGRQRRTRPALESGAQARPAARAHPFEARNVRPSSAARIANSHPSSRGRRRTFSGSILRTLEGNAPAVPAHHREILRVASLTVEPSRPPACRPLPRAIFASCSDFAVSLAMPRVWSSSQDACWSTTVSGAFRSCSRYRRDRPVANSALTRGVSIRRNGHRVAAKGPLAEAAARRRRGQRVTATPRGTRFRG
jgi:hypothetical protein